MRIVALAGGVGGARFVYGLAQHLSPVDLTVVVNTGDDFEHFGLTICPDLDTVCYTLAGLDNPQPGWGRVGETWEAISNVERLGGPSWFKLGDRDLGTHLERTRRLRLGISLSEITRQFCRAWGVEYPVLPMSDSPVRTMVNTEEGELPFQEYFVHRKCEPRVKGFRFAGIDSTAMTPEAEGSIQSADAIIICPSNPWVSIDPILGVGHMRSILKNAKVFAISPIIQGKTVKGPAAKMYLEMGLQPSASSVARHYRDILSGFVLDSLDAGLIPEIEELNVRTFTCNTLMNNLTDRARLAEDMLHFIGST